MIFTWLKNIPACMQVVHFYMQEHPIHIYGGFKRHIDVDRRRWYSKAALC